MGALGGLTDEVVRALLRGDELAFRAAYRELQPRLLRYVTVLVGPSQADDVASEAWMHCFRDLHRFEGGADEFRGWLTTIARNRAMDHLRAERRRVRVSGDLEDVVGFASSDDVEGSALSTVSTAEMLRLVARLPVDQREAIMLRTVLGFDAPSAAKILGKRSGAVRAASMRGLKSLARTLDRQPGEILSLHP